MISLTVCQPYMQAEKEQLFLTFTSPSIIKAPSFSNFYLHFFFRWKNVKRRKEGQDAHTSGWNRHSNVDGLRYCNVQELC